MNSETLLKFADYLNGLERAGTVENIEKVTNREGRPAFNMARWLTQRTLEDAPRRDVGFQSATNDFTATCGTAACIAGHLSVLRVQELMQQAEDRGLAAHAEFMSAVAAVKFEDGSVEYVDYEQYAIEHFGFKRACDGDLFRPWVWILSNLETDATYDEAMCLCEFITPMLAATAIRDTAERGTVDWSCLKRSMPKVRYWRVACDMTKAQAVCMAGFAARVLGTGTAENTYDD